VEDPRYLERWGTVLAAGKQLVTTMGTDCHRNTFVAPMQDGERVDSYRRLMLWFSNHLLIRPDEDGSWDDRHVKQALRSGRLYGAFEMLGYPAGFDYFAHTPSGTTEMGGVVMHEENPTLHVSLPQLRGFDGSKQAPQIQMRILRAVEGGFEEVVSGASDLDYQPTLPGAYRAEVRMIPYHLRDYMSTDAEILLAHDYAWIYSNAIHVR
jgi:hypothetical protein